MSTYPPSPPPIFLAFFDWPPPRRGPPRASRCLPIHRGNPLRATKRLLFSVPPNDYYFLQLLSISATMKSMKFFFGAGTPYILGHSCPFATKGFPDKLIPRGVTLLISSKTPLFPYADADLLCLVQLLPPQPAGQPSTRPSSAFFVRVNCPLNAYRACQILRTFFLLLFLPSFSWTHMRNPLINSAMRFFKCLIIGKVE